MDVSEMGTVGNDLAQRFTGCNNVTRRHPDYPDGVDRIPEETMLWAEPLFQFNSPVAFQTGSRPPRRAELAYAIDAGIDPDDGAYSLAVHPVSAWIDTAVALDERDGQFFLAGPRRISTLGDMLAAASGRSEHECARFIQQFLRWISTVKQQMEPEKHRNTLPHFQMHQYISLAGSVFSTLDHDAANLDSKEAGRHSVDDKVRKPMYRNVFSRTSGDTFVCVTKRRNHLELRDFREHSDNLAEAADGYLLMDEEIWDPQVDCDLLPAEWIHRTKKGPLPRAQYRAYFPIRIHFDAFGNCSETIPMKFSGWFMKAPLLFDPTNLFP